MSGDGRSSIWKLQEGKKDRTCGMQAANQTENVPRLGTRDPIISLPLHLFNSPVSVPVVRSSPLFTTFYHHTTAHTYITNTTPLFETNNNTPFSCGVRVNVCKCGEEENLRTKKHNNHFHGTRAPFVSSFFSFFSSPPIILPNPQ